jgi:two-component system, response regulator, stage 0 sporulation protein F
MKNILVVDDEPDMQFLFLQKFRKELRQGLLNFNFAFSADEALGFLREMSPEDIVLVLSDINMPGRSGIELLQIIKKESPGLKVIMVSAYNDDNHRSMAKKSGADDFISKPVDFDILKERILNEIAD